MNRCQLMKGQRNFSIRVPSHGFENNEELVDGRCSGTGSSWWCWTSGSDWWDFLVFDLFILGNRNKRS